MSGLHDQFRGYRHPFVFGIHYLGGIGDYPRTLVDLAMSQFSAEVRRIPDWLNLRLVPDVREEWAQMARGKPWDVRTPSSTVQITLSDKQIRYVLDELQGYAALYDHENSCQVSAFERIWEKTLPASDPLVQTLRAELANLRISVSASPWDDSGLCTSLIDPHSHPLIYNRTLVRTSRSSPLRTIPAPTGGDIYTISSTSAFLPTPILLPLDLKTPAVFLAYINNLDPTPPCPLYPALSMVLSHLTPLLSHVLTDLHRNNPLPQRISGSGRYRVWDEPDEPVHSDDEEGWVRYEAEVRHWAMHRPIELPDVPKGGYQGGLEERRCRVQLGGREVGVVISVEDIRLEPRGKGYEGSPWKVEGMRNERIVACGEYYIDVENITTPTLSLRMATTHPLRFSAGDTGATLRTWGLRDRDPSHQHIASIPLRPCLLLAFPNIYQTSLSPFSLLDTTRSGRLTVIRVGLVDPEIPLGLGPGRVVTTREVPPQQYTWTSRAVYRELSPKLPNEIVELILEGVLGMLREEAAEYEMELREVRETFREKNDQWHFCIPFDVWSGGQMNN